MHCRFLSFLNNEIRKKFACTELDDNIAIEEVALHQEVYNILQYISADNEIGAEDLELL